MNRSSHEEETRRTDKEIPNGSQTLPDMFRDIPVPYAIFQLIYDGSHSKVVDTRYQYVNEAYCQMSGFSVDKLIGRRFLDIYPGGVSWFPYCKEAREKNKSVHACHFSDEANHWLDFTVGPVSLPDAVAFVFTNVDEFVLKTRRETTTDEVILRISKSLNNEENFKASIEHALEELSQFIHPDRLYVLETDGRTVSNTFEWCASGVQPEIETLQNLDYGDYIGGWEKYLEKDSDVLISDIEELKDDDPVDYENLKRQGIERLLAAPFYSRGKLAGYLGADNYKPIDLINTQLVLNAISYFIGAKIINQRLLEDLNRLSHMDTLTNVHNRNAMIEKMNALKSQHLPVGLLYADVNGLKLINDLNGHEAGDRALCFSADLLVSYFGRNYVYRAGGDEFVVILPGIDEEKFREEEKALKSKLSDKDETPYHFSYGTNYCPDSALIEEAIRTADQEMYKEKERYYHRKGFDRRKINLWEMEQKTKKY